MCGLLPVTDGDRTFWHWESRFTTRARRRGAPDAHGRRGDLSGGFRRDPQTPAGGAHERAGRIMPVTVKTFASNAEAAAALSSDRGARYLGGGTLVMRAVNEGDLSFVVHRPLDRPSALSDRDRELRDRDSAPALRSPRSWPSATSPSCIRSRARSAARRCATTGTVGGNLFATPPYGDFAVALLALDATVTLQAALARANCRSKNSSPRAIAIAGRCCFRVACERPLESPSVPLPQSRARHARRAPPSFPFAAYLPASGGRVSGARIAYGAMAPTPMRAKAAERALEGRTLDAAGDRCRRSRSPQRAHRPPTTRSPAPGVAAKSSASICAAAARADQA